jgi:hypothetical protein
MSEADEKLEAWYIETYPDDPDVYNDHFLHVGYECALNWHGVVYIDAFDALDSPKVRDLLNGRGHEIRRFVRAYNKGVLDRPFIVPGIARHASPKLISQS